MGFLASVAVRRRRPEVMDQPGLDPRLHAEALRALERINWLSRSAGLLWPPLARAARAAAPRPLRVLDVASGAGDVTARLWSRARRAGLALEMDGCDVSPTAVAYAAERARRRGAGARFFAHDALAGPLPAGYDAVVCSLFLHHLGEAEAEDLLRRMAAAARLVLVNDLERSPTGLLLAHVASRLLTASPVVHADGPRSVEAAFTVEEARRLAEAAGLNGAVVERRWPCRFLLNWARP